MARSGLLTWLRPQDVLAIAIMAILSFAIDTTVGLLFQPVLVATLGPLTGGLVSAIPNAIVIFLGIYLVPRVGAPTLYALIFLSLTTVTASFGPPGFHKIFIGLGLGIIIDISLIIMQRRDWSYFVAVALAFGLSVDLTYLSWLWFGVSSADEARAALQPHLLELTFVYAALGLVGSGISYFIFKRRLASYDIVMRLRRGE